MKLIYKIFSVGALLGMTSCVDDYTEANPPALLDGPQAYVTPASNAVISRRSDGTDVVYTLKDQELTFSVLVPDAPGKIEAASAVLSDTIGTARVGDNFSAVKGSESGSFSVIYTPREDNPASTFDDQVVSLSTTVIDAQDKSTQPDVKRVRAVQWLPSRNVAGWWRATSSGTSRYAFIGDNGDYDEELLYSTYDNLTAYVRLQIRATGTTAATGGAATIILSTANAIEEHAGLLFLNDASFGLFSRQIINGQPRANPPGRVHFEGSDLTKYQPLNAAGTATTTFAGQPITMEGVINADGSITIEWSHTDGSSGTVNLVYDGN